MYFHYDVKFFCYLFVSSHEPCSAVSLLCINCRQCCTLMLNKFYIVFMSVTMDVNICVQ